MSFAKIISDAAISDLINCTESWVTNNVCVGIYNNELKNENIICFRIIFTLICREFVRLNILCVCLFCNILPIIRQDLYVYADAWEQ